MPDWDIHFKYDYRFNGMMLQVQNGEEISPMFTIALKDILDHVPPYEIRAALQPKHQTPDNMKGEDIQRARVELLESVDWKGKVCLDIGGYSGVMAKKALDLGASRAIVVDPEQWRHYGWAEERYDGVEYVKADLTEWTEPGDVVIAYNCLYHTHHPWRMLSHLRKITKPDGEMLLCTLFRYNHEAWMYVYNEREANPTDETVYFGPSLEALERMLRNTGWDCEKYSLAYDRVLYRCKHDTSFVNKHPEPGD